MRSSLPSPRLARSATAEQIVHNVVEPEPSAPAPQPLPRRHGARGERLARARLVRQREHVVRPVEADRVSAGIVTRPDTRDRHVAAADCREALGGPARSVALSRVVALHDPGVVPAGRPQHRRRKTRRAEERGHPHGEVRRMEEGAPMAAQSRREERVVRIPPGRPGDDRYAAREEGQNVLERGLAFGKLEGHVDTAQPRRSEAPRAARAARRLVHDERDLMPARPGRGLDRVPHAPVSHEGDLHAAASSSSKRVRWSFVRTSPTEGSGKTAATLPVEPPSTTISGAWRAIAARAFARVSGAPARPCPTTHTTACPSATVTAPREARRSTRDGVTDAVGSATPTPVSQAAARSAGRPSSAIAAATPARNAASMRSVRELTRTKLIPPRLAIAAKGGAPGGASCTTTVPGRSGAHVLSTRTGMPRATAGATEAGWRTFAP